MASKVLFRASLPSLRRPIRTIPSLCTSPISRYFSSSQSHCVMSLSGFTQEQLDVREAVSKICSKYPDEYWMEHDNSGEYPHELHGDLARDGWIGIALPEELGGAGLGISEATMMLHTIAESGAGIAGAQSIHANVYATQPVAKFASAEQRARMLPKLIAGETRTCFGVTEPNTGLETLKLTTQAKRDGDSYLISGQKIWISSAQVATKMVLLARTTPLSPLSKPSEGLSLFFIDLDKTAPGLDLKRIPKMGGRAIDANEVFFDNYRVPADTLIGKEGQGFKIVLHGLNAERCLLAGEALGLGYAALSRAASYAKTRIVFGRPIGQNQGIQHPLASAYMHLEAAKLATYHAARLYDQSAKEGGRMGEEVGVACNSAKYLAAEAAFTACERAVLTHGGMGYAQEYHVERYMREVFVPRIAPVSREMIMNYIGEKALGLPRSY
ncbi:acyl-CoA dehydrogenase NM domain-like protein [Amniculicola lignicola CBS 123094]|uniref:Acyl-CoA dehydrogenase NM domain-like protein n=1 Tax=Amniculicola lignicola CBS 123094 TaxID=1392246 RepID=A0A6A5WM53_9PLEO|nr:acyl-CoA dehydrogenase NM domain-like protein [Amniculicola lignicola CBS 123094]